MARCPRSAIIGTHAGCEEELGMNDAELDVGGFSVSEEKITGV